MLYFVTSRFVCFVPMLSKLCIQITQKPDGAKVCKAMSVVTFVNVYFSFKFVFCLKVRVYYNGLVVNNGKRVLHVQIYSKLHTLL